MAIDFGPNQDVYTFPLTVLSERVHKNSVDHGFWPEGKGRNFGEMLMLVTSELAEALEEDRNGMAPFYILDGKPEGAAVELIDAAIRILDMLAGMARAEALNPSVPGNLMPNVDELMAIKMDYNEGRPFMHGKGY
jgi:hypothetical protein